MVNIMKVMNEGWINECYYKYDECYEWMHDTNKWMNKTIYKLIINGLINTKIN